MIIPDDPIEGLQHNPVDHPAGRHESCESCDLWFPEAEIEFNQGKFRCPECRAAKLHQLHRRPGMLFKGRLIEAIPDDEEDAA